MGRPSKSSATSVHRSHTDDETRQLLPDVASKDTLPGWTNWARQRLALMGDSKAPPCHPRHATGLRVGGRPARERLNDTVMGVPTQNKDLRTKFERT